MLERFGGNFSYSKKLLALDINSFVVHDLSYFSHVGYRLHVNTVSLGNDAKSHMKYIAMGDTQLWIKDGVKLSIDDLTTNNVVDYALLRDNLITVDTKLKVYEDTSFWLQERSPLNTVVENVEKGHAILKMFMEKSHLPEGWSYWYSY